MEINNKMTNGKLKNPHACNRENQQNQNLVSWKDLQNW